MTQPESPLAIYHRHLSAGHLAYQYDARTESAVFPRACSGRAPAARRSNGG
ncbi:hypothetical protein WJ976_26810 [Achromobacter denitrificans]